MFNIIQVEFNLAQGSTPEEVLGNSLRIIAEDLVMLKKGELPGSGLKLVVRYHDDTGASTAYIEKEAQLVKQSKKVREQYFLATGVVRWWLERRFRRLGQKVVKLRKERNNFLIKALYRATQIPPGIAVEKSDHSFRFAEANELHELLEAASRSQSSWVFVFKPNELLSDKNTLVVHVW